MTKLVNVRSSKVIRFITQKLILLKWKQSQPPIVTYCFGMLCNNLAKIRYTHKGSTAKYCTRSSNPLLNMLECHRIFPFKSHLSFLGGVDTHIQTPAQKSNTKTATSVHLFYFYFIWFKEKNNTITQWSANSSKFMGLPAYLGAAFFTCLCVFSACILSQTKLMSVRLIGNFKLSLAAGESVNVCFVIFMWPCHVLGGLCLSHNDCSSSHTIQKKQVK